MRVVGTIEKTHFVPQMREDFGGREAERRCSDLLLCRSVCPGTRNLHIYPCPSSNFRVDCTMQSGRTASSTLAATFYGAAKNHGRGPLKIKAP